MYWQYCFDGNKAINEKSWKLHFYLINCHVLPCFILKTFAHSCVQSSTLPFWLYYDMILLVFFLYMWHDKSTHIDVYSNTIHEIMEALIIKPQPLSLTPLFYPAVSGCGRRCPGSLHPGLGLRTEGALRRPWKRTLPHRRLCRHCRGCCHRRHLTVWVCGSRQRKQNRTGSCKWSQNVSSKEHNSTSQPYIGFFGLYGFFVRFFFWGGGCVFVCFF